jgi:transposase
MSLNWLNKHLPENVRALNAGEWPPYSCDLTPIETLWTHLENRVIADECETVEELTEAVIDEWWKLPQTMLQNLISAVPKNIEMCFANDGGRFEKH